MKEQFFGRVFWIVLAAQAVIFCLAILFFETTFVSWFLVIFGLAVFFLSIKKLEYGMLVVFAELFANSHGHLFSVDFFGFSFSLRMVIFSAVIAAWILLLIFRKVSFPLKNTSVQPFLLLLCIVVMGFVLGFIQHDPSLVFQDGNAYLYLLYIFPLMSVNWDGKKQLKLLQTFAGSAAWVALLTLCLLFVFTHFPEWQLVEVYRFIRDTRTGELTRVFDHLYRIFLQSQFSVVAIFFFFFSFYWMQPQEKKTSFLEQLLVFFALAICFSVILISLSRSFWVGIIIGIGCFGVFYLLRVFKQQSWKILFRKKIFTLGAFLMGFLILGIVSFFPYPNYFASSKDFAGFFSSRADSDVAVTSRWKLVGPLWKTVLEEPIVGHGFGKEVEYETDDPRIREQNVSGLRKTYAFEWGWLEIMVKMGILGLLGFGLLFVTSMLGLVSYLTTARAWLGIGCISCLIMLYATHMFSPYLNHPLGLGFLLFLVPFYSSFPVRFPVQKMTVPSLSSKTISSLTKPSESYPPCVFQRVNKANFKK